MDMTRFSLAVVLIAGSFVLGACAQLAKPTAPTSPWFPSTARHFVSDGVGVSGCSQWEMAKRVHELDPYSIESWMLGFMSGLTYAEGPKYKPVDQLGVKKQLDEYCRAHPQARLQDAAIALSKRIPEATPPKPGQWEAPIQIP